MKPLQVIENKAFVGRALERAKLLSFSALSEAAIMILYGRRRVGKTELIEQTFLDRNLIKFEGLEKGSEQEQIKQVLRQLARYTEESYIARLDYDNWVEVFELIASKFQKGRWTLYFEELQWLANYEDKLISALKYVWDNNLRHNPELRIILCGSSPSFMINQVVQSKALYNRSTHTMFLRPFSLIETQQFLPKLSQQEIVMGYLLLGGIPEYLKLLRDSSSVFLSICEHAFLQDSFLSLEYERIFISSLADNVYYKKIVEYLSQKKYATRAELIKYLDASSGGNLTAVLTDLEICGFIKKYKPFQLNSGRGLYRYCVVDPYLVFYGKFIKPILSNIESGQYEENPSSAINQNSFHIWMGFAFERMIRQQKHTIAKILGFAGLPYNSGVYYSKATNEKDPGYQIDLLYEHSRHVYTICEIKYHTDLVGCEIIREMEKKLSGFENKKKHTIQKVLITTRGVTKELLNRAYFDKFIIIEDLFKSS